MSTTVPPYPQTSRGQWPALLHQALTPTFPAISPFVSLSTRVSHNWWGDQLVATATYHLGPSQIGYRTVSLTAVGGHVEAGATQFEVNASYRAQGFAHHANDHLAQELSRGGVTCIRGLANGSVGPSAWIRRWEWDLSAGTPITVNASAAYTLAYEIPYDWARTTGGDPSPYLLMLSSHLPPLLAPALHQSGGTADPALRTREVGSVLQSLLLELPPHQWHQQVRTLLPRPAGSGDWIGEWLGVEYLSFGASVRRKDRQSATPFRRLALRATSKPDLAWHSSSWCPQAGCEHRIVQW